MMKTESARAHTYTRDRDGARRKSFIRASKMSRTIMYPSVERKRKREIKAPAPFMCPSPSIESVSQVTFISSPSSNSVHNLASSPSTTPRTTKHASCTRAHT